MSMQTNAPLISIIIPCYNHGQYLSTAIESSLAQSYKTTEIIVVDDGSTDNTKEIAQHYPQVKYVYQSNGGLSAARNKGLATSKGSYLVFLDADDWLLPDALSTNLPFLLQNPRAGFVAGSYIRHNENTKKEDLLIKGTKKASYKDLLQGNIISMHAAVMYPRWIFDTFQYDTTLKACEDWDLYLKIGKQYEILHHETPVAVYRRYGHSMSGNFKLMLESGMEVLSRQENEVADKMEKDYLLRGKERLKRKYTKKIYQYLMQQPKGNEKIAGMVQTLWQYNKYLYCKYTIKKYLSAKPLNEVKPIL